MRAILSALALAALIPNAAHAEVQAPAQAPACDQGVCKVSLTASQLLATASQLVSEHRFAEAAPMLAALENAPQFAVERQFLIGYAAVENGDLKSGIKSFRNILDKHPDQTRVRLELARALMLKGDAGASDHHFRIAQADKDVPQDIASTIRASRRLLRDSQKFSFGLDLGIAPDSNINSGTSAETVDIAFGSQTIPLTLDQDARARSGVGQSLGLASAARFGLGGDAKLLVEADSQIINYSGKRADDIQAQLAVGPEFRLSDATRLSIQALGSKRWFGGDSAQLSGGLRANLRTNLGDSSRLGFSLDARRNDSQLATAYSGWQLGGTASFEHILAKSLIASASLFARRDLLNSDSFSGKEYGANLGIGGELPLGINAGISGGVSRANFDAAIALFGSDPRHEWRLNGRVQLGLRAMRLLGFSPSVTYSFTQTQSTLTLYDNTRHRIRFGLARYF